jgi:hypothetical protein
LFYNGEQTYYNVLTRLPNFQFKTEGHMNTVTAFLQQRTRFNTRTIHLGYEPGGKTFSGDFCFALPATISLLYTHPPHTPPSENGIIKLRDAAVPRQPSLFAG